VYFISIFTLQYGVMFALFLFFINLYRPHYWRIKVDFVIVINAVECGILERISVNHEYGVVCF